MNKLELLSPAQNIDCAIAAINSGADAVYIGATNFGARKNAANSIEDIKKLVGFAHLFNVKVYVTLNTILTNKELIETEKLINSLYQIKVDALIIQDFGILSLALQNKIPPIVLHMSTQADNRVLEKIKFFEEIGIKRVILARELPLETIEKINKKTHIELEHFVAGALCVSYSGLCYLSQYIGKRSANRGECAQACRKKYSLIDKNNKTYVKNQYLLSLKDNNLSKHIDKLVKAGVTSFKIEGRLKDENYVKNNTLFYHNLLKNYPRISNGKIMSDFIPNPEKTFNRGFCDDYLFKKKDNIYNFTSPKSIGEYLGNIQKICDNYFVIKTDKKINPSDGLYFLLNNEPSGCLVNKAEAIKGGVKIYPNKKINLKVKDKIYRNIDVEFNKQLKNSKTIRKLEINFIVKNNEIIVYDENNHKEKIKYNYQEVAKEKNKMIENFKKALSKTSDTPFEVNKIEFIIENEIGFLPVSLINELRRELLEKLKIKILSSYKVKKQKPIDIAKFPIEKNDYTLNCHNDSAVEFYDYCGVKIKEMSLESSENYKNKELMRTKHCLKRAIFNCDFQEELFLVDEKNVKFPLVFDCKNCEMIIKSPEK